MYGIKRGSGAYPLLLAIQWSTPTQSSVVKRHKDDLFSFSFQFAACLLTQLVLAAKSFHP